MQGAACLRRVAFLALWTLVGGCNRCGPAFCGCVARLAHTGGATWARAYKRDGDTLRLMCRAKPLSRIGCLWLTMGTAPTRGCDNRREGAGGATIARSTPDQHL